MFQDMQTQIANHKNILGDGNVICDLKFEFWDYQNK